MNTKMDSKAYLAIYPLAGAPPPASGDVRAGVPSKDGMVVVLLLLLLPMTRARRSPGASEQLKRHTGNRD